MARPVRVDIANGWYHVAARGTAIIRVVESELGRRWRDFSDVYGDRGRDLALYLARKRSGLTLREIGEHTGASNYKTVSVAVRRFEARIEKDATCRRLVR